MNEIVKKTVAGLFENLDVLSVIKTENGYQLAFDYEYKVFIGIVDGKPFADDNLPLDSYLEDMPEGFRKLFEEVKSIIDKHIKQPPQS